MTLAEQIKAHRDRIVALCNQAQDEVSALNALLSESDPDAVPVVLTINATVTEGEDGPPANLTKEEWAEALGLRATWLAPVLPTLRQLEQLAGNDAITNEQLLAAAEQLLKKFPELHFDPTPLVENLTARMVAGAAAEFQKRATA